MTTVFELPDVLTEKCVVQAIEWLESVDLTDNNYINVSAIEMYRLLNITRDYIRKHNLGVSE